ncbi:MAG: cytidylate kinase [Planctomycetes bacterium GWF2_42_9]|nr:MAG: cytidylate kinase [Planctomycetes bacterium GWF2_42_9]HAL45859.1 (d)CMP kinase [Phycisphaerales bacterium]
MAKLIITIDGPAGSGKSSTAKLLAAKINASFLDTGAMYRAVTLAAMQKGCDFNDVSQLEKIIDNTNFEFKIKDGVMVVKIAGEDVTEKIRDPQVTGNVRFVAAEGSLRARLVKLQREFAAGVEQIVTEGRDQGTVVFPDANLKIFLTADNTERAKRRAMELSQNGYKVDVTNLQKEIEIRDLQDTSRKVAPLTPAKDAVMIDTTNFTLEQVVEEILKLVKNSVG